MFKTKEDEFVEESLELIRYKFKVMGVGFIGRRLSEWRETVIKIGKMYHQLKKEEEI